MSDSMKFGPQWLRALSGDGPSATALAPLASSKCKLADFRYGREEMLALYQGSYHPGEYTHLKQHPLIYVEDTQPPVSIQPLSEDEQRLMAQGVNSQVVMRTSRGGAAPIRGGWGGAVERGRGRGRGRGDGYSRLVENGDIGGFGRPRGPNKDGWEEVGNRKLERYPRPLEEGQPRYSRSMSDNWRDKGPNEEEDDGDWRKLGSRERWVTRTSWRESGRGAPDADRRNGAFTRSRGFESDDRGRRLDVPEWADDGEDDVGTFDATGAFVSNKERPTPLDRRENRENYRVTSDHSQMQDEIQTREKEEDPPERETTGKSGSSSLPNGTETLPQATGDGSAPSLDHDKDPLDVRKLCLPVVNVPTVDASLSKYPQNADQGDTVKEEESSGQNAKDISTRAENALKWFYMDPQGEMQGPFSKEEMAQWFSAGYFTMLLRVKRGCDPQFQPLGDLMRQHGQVPFLPAAQSSQQPVSQRQPEPPATAPAPAPMPAPAPVVSQPVSLPPEGPPTTTPSLPLGLGDGSATSLLTQQQIVLQHQILTLQVAIQEMQVEQMQQIITHASFKNLDKLQQSSLCVQTLQSNPVYVAHMNQLQALQRMEITLKQQIQMTGQGLGPPIGAPTPAAAVTNQHALHSQHSMEAPLATQNSTFQRSLSQPTASSEGQGDIPSIWGMSQPAGGWSASLPTSVWDLDNQPAVVQPQGQMDKREQEKKAELAKLEEVERRHKEEMLKQQEELERQKEALQREKEEFERQRLLELQKLEESRKQKEEEQQQRQRELEAERRRQEEEALRRQREEEEESRREEQRRREEEKRMREEQKRIKEEMRRQEEEEEERRKHDEVRQKREAEERALQEMKRQEEQRQQQEAERQRLRELEKQQEVETALKKLPSSANWARQQQQQQQEQQQSGRTLADIQLEEEERQERQEREREQMMRLQQEILAQQKQAMQQKSWASNLASHQTPGHKSLAEIQEEEERELRQEKNRLQQLKQQQAQQMSLASAAVWGPSTLGGALQATSASVWGSDSSLGLWGSVSPQPAQGKKTGNSNQQGSAEFPALRSQKMPKFKTTTSNKGSSQSSKPKKDEEVVQRLFKSEAANKDEFSNWCENYLNRMGEIQIDVETFVTFLRAVDSPYEVHDYVKSYLGEGNMAKEFAKQFIERRSLMKNKARNEKRQEEESIWGPAPALNPRESRMPSQTASLDGFSEVSGKTKGAKKKKKMQKLDGSTLLGFTVAKDPNRKNAGEIESID